MGYTPPPFEHPRLGVAPLNFGQQSLYGEGWPYRPVEAPTTPYQRYLYDLYGRTSWPNYVHLLGWLLIAAVLALVALIVLWAMMGA